MKTILIIGALVFFGCTIHPQAQVPTGPTFQGCSGGGLVFMNPLAPGGNPVYRCVDPTSVGKQTTPAPAITGGPCTPPASGVTLYVKLPDASCLPLTAIPAPGQIAEILSMQSTETAMVNEPTQTQIQVAVGIRAAPGSGLVPNADGTAFIPAP